MKKVYRWLMMLINLVFAATMIGGFISRFVSPVDFWFLSFLGLVFPLFALLNLLFLVYWLILFKKPVWISLIALLVVMPGLNSSVRIFGTHTNQADSDPVSILTYNVRLFDIFDWSGKSDTGTRLLDYVGQEGADIVCFQEFMTNNSNDLNINQIKSLLPKNNYAFIEYNYQAYKRKHGLAIFSSYPVLSGKKGHFPGTRNMYIYADILLPFDTVRVINAHLESIHLNSQQYNLIDSLNVSQNNRQEITRIFHNIREAFEKRAEQVSILSSEIENSPYPVVLCGDFNDTPVSYAYRILTKDLKDSFVESGYGLGTSYTQFMLPLRIDYIMHSKELASYSHEVLNADYSDHKPVKTFIKLKN